MAKFTFIISFISDIKIYFKIKMTGNSDRGSVSRTFESYVTAID